MKTKKEKHLAKSCSCDAYELTPEQIYNIVSGNDNNYGIPGYKCPKKYFDYRACVWLKKREQILKKHKREWPPINWPADKETDKKMPPKRINFIDEQIKWVNSFNDKKKSEEVKEALEAKGKTFGEPHPFKSDFDKKKCAINLGNKFREREKELEKIREQIKAVPDFKQSAIEQVQDKIKSGEEYKGRSGHSNWGKCDRIMYNSDGEYVGEQYPFWNPNPKEEDKKKAEFYPNKIKFLHKNPVWTIGPKNKDKSAAQEASQYIKARDERLEEKADSVFQKMGVDKKSFLPEPVKSYHLIHNHGKLPLVFRKVFDYANTDQYKSSMENKTFETPAPNTYWDDGKSKIKLRKNIDDDQAHRYVMPREKTYKRLYVSGLRKSVY